MDALVEMFQKLSMWFGSRPNRLRLKGARIEVIALIVAKKPTPAILLGQSHYHDIWMPPQEGVRIKETMAEALHRCLREECGVDVPEDEAARRKAFYTRSIRYVDTLDLVEERVEERPVADDALGTPFENVRLRRKAYWLATVIVRDRADLVVKPDGIEMEKLKWFAPNEARNIIEKTNHPPKAKLLALCLDLAMKDFHGATKAP
jgi:ADP-ribose pyrophosphatase YjhB (NUDIX family)